MRFTHLCLLLCLSLSASLFAQNFEVYTDRALADYQVGETITFIVDTDQTGVIDYKIRYSLRTAPIQEGQRVHSGGTTAIQFSLNSPGFLTFEARIGNNYKAIAATVSKEDIGALSTEPADFDEFWNAQKAQLAAIPLDIVDFKIQENQFSDTYSFSLAQVDGRRVYGYVVIPRGEGPFPAILQIPPFGAGRNTVTPNVIGAERANAISLSVNIHNAPPNQEDPNAYQPNGIKDRETIYYRYAILAMIRAIDYLETIDVWNGKELCIYGDSQGGGLSMLVAGIDQRASHLIQSVGALSQHGGKRVGRPSGFPYYLESADALYQTQAERVQVFEATKYYDAIFAARRFRGTSMHFANYLDDVCPPATSYAAHNAMPGPRIMLHSLDLNHGNSSEYANDRRLFYREHFEASRTPSFQFEPNTRSHFIDAGAQTSVQANTALTLTPTFGLNNAGPDSDWTVKWEVLEGPGNVIFSNSTDPNTTVQFSEAGQYRLRLIVLDPYPEEARKYWTLTDEVSIDVSPSGSTCTLSARESNKTCDDNGTPNDPTDDTFSFDVVVSNNGACSNSWSNGVTSGLYNQPRRLGPFPISQGMRTITFRDATNSLATTSLNVSAPQPCSTAGGRSVDLALSATTTNPNPGAYALVSTTFTISNNGTSAEQGITVTVPQPTGCVYEGGNEFSLTQGDFSNFSGNWNVGSLGVGEQASLTLNFFTLTADEIFVYGQVLAQASTDLDSNPNNGTPPSPTEDDEAVVYFNGLNGGAPHAVDLELATSATTTTPDAFTFVSTTFVLSNTGSIPEQGVSVHIPTPAGLVLQGGNEYSATSGTFSNGIWSITSLAPGSQESITVNFFTLSENEISVYGQVLAQASTDLDSSPGNGVSPTPFEDDEAAVTLNGTGTICNIQAAVDNIRCDDRGTLNDPGDDQWSFDLLVTASNNCGSNWTSNLGAGSYDSPQTFGPFNIAAGNVNFSIQDELNPNVNTTVAAIAPSGCSNGSPGVDLELDLVVDNPNPGQWAEVPMRLTLRNTGTETATNVRVDFINYSLFEVSNVLAYVTSAASPTTRFEEWRGIWSIPSLAGGESVTLEYTAYSKSLGQIDLFAEVLLQDQTEQDSSPNNGNGVRAQEDDEASFTLNASMPLVLFSADKLGLYPNPADEYVIIELGPWADVPAEFEVRNALGKLMLKRSWNALGDDSVELSTALFPPGYYMVLVRKPGHNTYTLPFVKVE
jgi:cephalosporin-C deacetylase